MKTPLSSATAIGMTPQERLKEMANGILGEICALRTLSGLKEAIDHQESDVAALLAGSDAMDEAKRQRELLEAIDADRVFESKMLTDIVGVVGEKMGECGYRDALEGVRAMANRITEMESLIGTARSILFASEDNEATADPWWAIVKSTRPGREEVLAGPFFSRKRAESMLEARRHDWGRKAFVFCFSGYYSAHYKELRATLKPKVGGQ